RNALRSWRELTNVNEIVLIGDDKGVAETAAEFGVLHFGNRQTDRFGTPLLGEILRIAEEVISEEWMCYVNSDIILTSSFGDAVARAATKLGHCLIVSRRWNLGDVENLDFSGGWENRLHAIVAQRGELFTP